MTDAREPSRGGARAASPHEVVAPVDAFGAASSTCRAKPHPAAPRADRPNELAWANRCGGDASRGSGRRRRGGARRRQGGRVDGDSGPKAEPAVGSSCRNSRPPLKWTRPPPQALNTTDTTRASPFLDLTGVAPCHVRNTVIGLPSRTRSIRPFGCLSTLLTRGSIGRLTITSTRVERAFRTARPTLTAAPAATLSAGLGGVCERVGETSAAHPAEVPSRDVPDITAPNRRTTTFKGCCDLRHTFRVCRTTPAHLAPERKVKLGDRVDTPRTDW